MCITHFFAKLWLKYTCYPSALLSSFFSAAPYHPASASSLLLLPELSWMAALCLFNYQILSFEAMAPLSHWPCCPLAFPALSTTIIQLSGALDKISTTRGKVNVTSLWQPSPISTVGEVPNSGAEGRSACAAFTRAYNQSFRTFYWCKDSGVLGW